MGCVGGCNEPCLAASCVPAEAAEITVTASNGPIGIAGLMVAGASSNNLLPCEPGSGGTVLCRIYGGAGDYHLTVSAPGYQSVALNFTVTEGATTAGCHPCGTYPDTRILSVVMQPGSA